MHKDIIIPFAALRHMNSVRSADQSPFDQHNPGEDARHRGEHTIRANASHKKEVVWPSIHLIGLGYQAPSGNLRDLDRTERWSFRRVCAQVHIG